MVRIGMYLEMRNPPQWRQPSHTFYGRWLERIEEAERLGADSVWLAEHHFFDDGHLPQCWTMHAAIAARTRTVRLGTALTILPLRPVADLAEQIALVDVISGGRVEAGFGVGYRAPEYEGFGEDFGARVGGFSDRVRTLRQLWGEEAGARRVATPPPVQQPIPLWAGFGRPRGARRAGELGMGLLSMDPALLEPYRDGLVAGGHDPATARMASHFEVFVTDDPEKAWAEIEDHVVYRWQSLNRYMFEGTEHEGAETHPYFQPDAIRQRILIGTAEDIAATIHAQVGDLPVTDLYLFSDFPGVSEDVVDRHIELTFTQLAPLLRDPRS